MMCRLLSVTRVLQLYGRFYWKTYYMINDLGAMALCLQNFSDASARVTFSNLGLNTGGAATVWLLVYKGIVTEKQ